MRFMDSTSDEPGTIIPPWRFGSVWRLVPLRAPGLARTVRSCSGRTGALDARRAGRHRCDRGDTRDFGREGFSSGPIGDGGRTPDLGWERDRSNVSNAALLPGIGLLISLNLSVILKKMGSK